MDKINITSESKENKTNTQNQTKTEQTNSNYAETPADDFPKEIYNGKYIYDNVAIETPINILHISQALADAYNTVFKTLIVNDSNESFMYYSSTQHVWVSNANHGELMVRLLCNNYANVLYETAHECEKKGNADMAKMLIDKGKQISQLGNNQPSAILKSMLGFLPSVKYEIMDLKPDIVNLKNGVYNLKTCTFEDHKPDNLCFNMVNASYIEHETEKQKAACIRWKKWIKAFCVDENGNYDPEKERFLQMAIGAGLSGYNVLPAYFLYGRSTGNGKTTFINIINAVFRRYHAPIHINTIMRKKQQTDNPSQANVDDYMILDGYPRYVTATEGDSDLNLNSTLADGKFKRLTGRDTIVVRKLYGMPRSGISQATILIATNHLPIIKDSTVFESGRIAVIPCYADFRNSNEIKDMSSILTETEEGRNAILKWGIEGYEEYMRNGQKLPYCKAVEEETRKYRYQNDPIQLFIDTRCDIHADEENRHMLYSEKPGIFYQAYKDCCYKNGLECSYNSPQSFLKEVIEMKYRNSKGERKNLIRRRTLDGFNLVTGISLKPSDTEENHTLKLS